MTKIILLFSTLSALTAQAAPKALSKAQAIAALTQGTSLDVYEKQSVDRHFRDSNKFYPDLRSMSLYTLPRAKTITGKNFILTPLSPWNYKYDIFPSEGEMVIRVKIHFKNIRENEFHQMQDLIQQAEDIWNDGAPQILSFKYRFQFDVVRKSKEGYISVGLLNDTRGPFYVNWSRTWGAVGIAHEIGHMMGLSDEYNEMAFSGTQEGLHCDLNSIMCNGWWGQVKDYHYYHILRRALAPTK